ncbi:MAG TPA: hypothetical protein VLA72_14880 [Anaerolineales bacterium]|nr:hypothetical protein [Anaerolineales bacterium]
MTGRLVRSFVLWIWNLIAHYFSDAIQILDLYHAADRMERSAEEDFSDSTERQV